MRFVRLLLWAVLISVFIACAASAAIYDLASDFSITDGNPNGVWTYGWAQTDFTGFTLYTNSGINSVSSPQWYGWGGDWTPCIWKNISAGAAYGVPTGWTSLHPGDGTQPSIARWTAPTGTDGNVSINGSFLAGDGGSMIVSVLKNNAVIWTNRDSGDFSLSEYLVAGDTIDFAVSGGYAYGNTPISATITTPTTTAVPEPTSIVLFGIPMLVVGISKIRRRY